jgi:signal transduction histidine kinase
MRSKLSEGDQPFLDRSVWAEPLFKFAQVSKLVISLYDRDGKRWCGPCFNQGFAARLARSGIWDDSGWASVCERRLVQRALAQGEPVHELVLDLFGQLAVPFRHEGEVVLVFVLGWVPQHDPDASTLKGLAEQLGLPLEEIWQLIRSMPPIPEDRLRTHGHILEIFSANLLQRLTLYRNNQQELTGWKILSDTAFALSGVTVERDICQIVHKALRGLLFDAYCVIKLIPATGPLDSAVVYENEDRGVVSMMPHVSSVRRHFSIPILGKRDQLFGQIDITFEFGKAIDFYLETLYVLAGQLGVALQKSRLLSAGEKEPRNLEAGNAELQGWHKVKDDFLAAVSHELKMPLNAITSWAQTLREDGLDVANYRDALRTIERSARHQSRLIEDLLDISRMISGGMDLECEDVDVTQLLLNTLDSVMPMFQLRTQKLQRNISEHSLRIRGDGVRLHQVFWNLLSNASKFTQDGGQITVTLEGDGPSIRFEVTDFGKGIAAADVTRLFHGFQQKRPSPSGEAGGLGLGLAIVKHLVDMHGGSVAVTSEGEGSGATFRVLLPQSATGHGNSQVRIGRP